MYLFGARKKTYSVGIATKKLPNGQWIVIVDGRKIIANLITDEPIAIGSRVRLTIGSGPVQKPMILGADK